MTAAEAVSNCQRQELQRMVPSGEEEAYHVCAPW
jgi:hypothetical protein